MRAALVVAAVFLGAELVVLPAAGAAGSGPPLGAPDADRITFSQPDPHNALAIGEESIAVSPVIVGRTGLLTGVALVADKFAGVDGDYPVAPLVVTVTTVSRAGSPTADQLASGQVPEASVPRSPRAASVYVHFRRNLPVRKGQRLALFATAKVGHDRGGYGWSTQAAANAVPDMWLTSPDYPTWTKLPSAPVMFRTYVLAAGQTLTGAASATAITYVHAVTLRAALQRDGVGLSGKRIVLYRRWVTPKAHGRWWYVAARTSDRQGMVQVSDRPPVTVQYQWRYASSRSEIRLVKVATRVSARFVASRPAAGAVAHLVGSVAPRHPGYLVEMQRPYLVNDEVLWRTVARTRLSATSTFRFAFRVAVADAGWYRVRAPADMFHVTGDTVVQLWVSPATHAR